METQELANIKLSCLHLAMDAAKVTGNSIKTEEVLKTAKEFEDFVLGK